MGYVVLVLTSTKVHTFRCDTLIEAVRVRRNALPQHSVHSVTIESE